MSKQINKYSFMKISLDIYIDHYESLLVETESLLDSLSPDPTNPIYVKTEAEKRLYTNFLHTLKGIKYLNYDPYN